MRGNDLVERFGDGAGLVPGEVAGEVPLDPGEVGRRGGAERSAAGPGDDRQAGPPIVGVGLAADQAGVGEAVDQAADPVEVTIEMASVGSGDQARDNHLRSADFFDVEHHPTATYRSSQVLWAGSRGTVHGELTIKGAIRPVTLEVDYLGHVRDPWGGDRAVFSAWSTINREDWGLTWNMPLESGGVLVSKEIRLEIEVETVRRAP